MPDAELLLRHKEVGLLGALLLDADGALGDAESNRAIQVGVLAVDTVAIVASTRAGVRREECLHPRERTLHARRLGTLTPGELANRQEGRRSVELERYLWVYRDTVAPFSAEEPLSRGVPRENPRCVGVVVYRCRSAAMFRADLVLGAPRVYRHERAEQAGLGDDAVDRIEERADVVIVVLRAEPAQCPPERVDDQ